jgi:hypothetical protein
MSSEVPLLSIVITGRAEMPAFERRRFLGALRFNHEQLAARRVPHEVVLVELAPSPDHPSLRDLVSDDIRGLKDERLASVVIDCRYREAIGEHSLRMVANNVGIRRAHGAFIMSIGPGTCLGRRLLTRIAEGTIVSGVVHRAPRVDVRIERWEDLRDCDALEQRDRIVGRISIPYGGVYPSDAADFILLDAAAFHQLRGFDENRSAPQLGVESFLVKARANAIPVCSLGAPVYHVREASEHGVEPLPWTNAVEKYVGHVNPETWGLAAAQPREVAPQCVWLNYDSTIVPPLVDLRRLMPVRTTADVQGGMSRANESPLPKAVLKLI